MAISSRKLKTYFLCLNDEATLILRMSGLRIYTRYTLALSIHGDTAISPWRYQSPSNLQVGAIRGLLDMAISGFWSHLKVFWGCMRRLCMLEAFPEVSEMHIQSFVKLKCLLKVLWGLLSAEAAHNLLVPQDISQVCPKGTSSNILAVQGGPPDFGWDLY